MKAREEELYQRVSQTWKKMWGRNGGGGDAEVAFVAEECCIHVARAP